jgi:hypothetical protein
MGLGWFIAMVWAYYKSETPTSAELDSDPDLKQRVVELENQLRNLQAGGSES